MSLERKTDLSFMPDTQGNGRQESQSKKRKTLRTFAAGLALSSALIACKSESEPIEPPSAKANISGELALRQSLAKKTGHGYEVLSNEQEKALDLASLSPDTLSFAQVKKLYLNSNGTSDNDRLMKWVYPQSDKHAGETSHYSLNETGKPATIAVPKGIDVRTVTYVDSINNKEEEERFSNSPLYDPLLVGENDQARVFYGVDSIILDLPPKD